MTAFTLPAVSFAARQLTISVKANVREPNVMPELKRRAHAGLQSMTEAFFP